MTRRTLLFSDRAKAICIVGSSTAHSATIYAAIAACGWNIGLGLYVIAEMAKRKDLDWSQDYLLWGNIIFGSLGCLLGTVQGYCAGVENAEIVINNLHNERRRYNNTGFVQQLGR